MTARIGVAEQHRCDRAAVILQYTRGTSGPSMTPLTLLSHGISTGPPVLSTTMVFGLAAATASIIATCTAVGQRDALEIGALGLVVARENDRHLGLLGSGGCQGRVGAGIRRHRRG